MVGFFDSYSDINPDDTLTSTSSLYSTPDGTNPIVPNMVPGGGAYTMGQWGQMYDTRADTASAQGWTPDSAAANDNTFNPDGSSTLAATTATATSSSDTTTANDNSNTDWSCYRPITQAEQDLAKNGQVVDFWNSRQQNGDPIADIALGTINAQSSSKPILGTAANAFLEGSAILNTGKSVDLDSIHRDLMNAHVDATLANGNGTQPLTPEQVASYHYDVFNKYGLPPGTFGGTPFSSDRGATKYTKQLWYKSCN